MSRLGDWIAASTITNEERRAKTEKLLNILREDPGCVEAVRVLDNDPITVQVKCLGCDWQPLDGIYGVSAMRLFYDIRTVAPTAEATVKTSDREVVIERFDKGNLL